MSEPDLAAWVGRTEVTEDRITQAQAARMAATLDMGAPDLAQGASLPRLWHWMGWTPAAPMSRLGPDGHPERGGFMPPVPLPRRMFAGARIAWDGDLMIGEPLSRQSEILKVTEKQGSQGAMVFVTVRHVIAGAAGRLTEEQDIVYLPMPTAWRAPPPAPAPAVPDWTEVVDCTEARLFRFSALTFNAHRIHYDLAYATTVEHYPALVVHGPLQAMLVLAAAEARGAPRPDGFSFRGQRPAFHDQPLTLNGAGARVWTGAPDGSPCLVAELT